MAFWQIVFYPPKGERRSAYDFILSLPAVEQAAVTHRLGTMRSFHFADWPGGWFNQLEGKVFELYVDQYRIAFCLDDRTIVVLHAFEEDRQRTHPRDLDTAIRHYNRYLESKGDR